MYTDQKPSWAMYLQPTRRPQRPVVIGGVALLLVVVLLLSSLHAPIREKALSFTSSSASHDDTHDLTTPPSDKKLHLLLPASHAGVDLCKTLLTGAILGYPTPTLIAWNQTYDDNGLLAGGSHKAKISETLKYLESMDPSQDDDLVMMMDAYDIWFQLRPETLISRYYSMNAAANKRLRDRLGKAVDKEKLSQRIIFGAGKRCAPNQLHTVACYPLPASPVPDDTYGNNTDTEMGKNIWVNNKQRYLNSGSIIGPVADVRRMFERASQIAQARKDHDEWDNGCGNSDFAYHGSDQAIFAIMFGQQEFQREVMRRRHLTSVDKMRGRGKPQPLRIGSVVIEDPLKPHFLHEPEVWKAGQPDEFGIGLDYFSDLIHQTINAEDDAHYLVHGKDIDEQLKDRKGIFMCPNRVDGTLPADVVNTPGPLADLEGANLPWEEASLYTNLCMDTIPIMIHHNGDKGARHWQWPMTWMEPHARKLLDNARAKSAESHMVGGAVLPDGDQLGWDELCPAINEWELYRDVEKPEKPVD